MDENNSADSQDAQKTENFARKDNEDQPQKDTAHPHPTEEYPEDEFGIQMRRFAGYIAREWNKLDFAKRVEVSIGVGGLLVLIVYTTYTALMYSANKTAADAAKSAADTASNQLILTERPWLKIKHRIISTLTFNVDQNGGPAAIMTLEDTIENTGQSVAVNVLHWEEIIPLDADTLGTETARARQKQYCDVNRHPAKGGLQGYTLFPHDPNISNSEIGVSMTEIVAQELHDDPKRPWFRLRPNDPLNGTVGFVIVGCVFYRSTFEPTDSPTHQTRFMYRLGAMREGGLFYPWVSPSGIASKLQLIAIPDGFTAD